MRRILPCLVLALTCLGGLVAGPVQARTLRLQAEAVDSGVGRLGGVDATLRWPEGAETGELVLRVAHLEFPLLAYQANEIEWRCPVQRGDDGLWSCRGPANWRGGRAASVGASFSPAVFDADLAVDKSRVAVQTLAAVPDQARISLEAVPVAWMQAFLASLWADGQWNAGRVSGRIDLAMPASGPLGADAALDLAGLGLETPDGWLAAAGVDAHLRLEYLGQDSDTRVGARLTTRGGEFLASGLYVALPSTPVEIAVEARQASGKGWQLPSLSWTDGQVLRARGQARLGADATLQDLDVSLALGDLAVARDRYLSGFLAPAGFPDMVLGGKLDADIALRGGQLDALSVVHHRMNAIDPRQRFILSGLDGDVRWHRGQEVIASRLAWDNAALYGIGLGPARLDFRSADGELILAAPASVDALGGRISLDSLAWQPPSPSLGARFQLGATLVDLDLGSLSQRLGWPPFTGTLAGRIPSARYQDGILSLDGGVAVQVFGGSVALTSLVMERPFGVAPTLSGDIAIEDVDLEPMTEVFGFGSITGRLDGRIAGLRMVNWSPVAFDARLQTDTAWKGKRRISQRAVEDISKVGGSGLVAGLQTQVLKFFDDFGYARIGLGCKLRDNVCAMSGVGSAGEGYIIVEGAGLPRIQVVGFRRQVDWPTLLDRLAAATEGQAPIIQ